MADQDVAEAAWPPWTSLLLGVSHSLGAAMAVAVHGAVVEVAVEEQEHTRSHLRPVALVMTTSTDLRPLVARCDDAVRPGAAAAVGARPWAAAGAAGGGSWAGVRREGGWWRRRQGQGRRGPSGGGGRARGETLGDGAAGGGAPDPEASVWRSHFGLA
uniref:Uncharacterized protein n=1 Tax=Setaria viridis TaxID=4556 RepID=A0A4U6VN71_SETVI|nr:hypothetical protein SEVIR_3G150600v2 [Setaria viridis]